MSRIAYIFVGGIGLLIAANTLFGDKRPREEINRDESIKNCTSTSGASGIAEKFVSKSLRSPSTAKFAGYSDTKIDYLGDCRHRVSAYVDSQNGYGAMVRTYYVAVVKSTGFDGKMFNYTLESLDTR